MEREIDFEIFTLIDRAREMTLLSSGVTSISPLSIWATFFLSRWHLILVLKEILENLPVPEHPSRVDGQKMGFRGIKRH